MKTMVPSFLLSLLTLASLPASAACPRPYRMADSAAPAAGDRVGAILYLGSRVPGTDVRRARTDLDRLGLWYGMWFQTTWQGTSGRNRYRCWDGRTERPAVGSPLWQRFNWTLTILPYEIYRRSYERKAPCRGSALEVATCEAWMAYFRRARAYQRDLAAGRYDSLVGRVRKVVQERRNQAAMWKAHTTSLALARAALPADRLTTAETGFLRGWASMVHYLDQLNFPTTRTFITVFGKTMPRCFPLGSARCQLRLDPTERVGLNPLQLGFAKAVLAYDGLRGLPAVVRAALRRASGRASSLQAAARSLRKRAVKTTRSVTARLGAVLRGLSRGVRSVGTTLRSLAKRVWRSPR